MSTPSPLMRDTAAYLQTLRAQLQRANLSRKGWISQVGLLLADLQHGTSSDVIAAVAGRSGGAQGEEFRAIRAEVARVDPPSGCETCHLAVMGWLDKQIAACDLLVEIGRTREAAQLREVRGLIAEARHDARQFSYEISERMAALRHRRAALSTVGDRSQPVRPRGRAGGGRGGRRAPTTGAARTGSLWGRVARLFGGEGPDLARTAS